MSPPLWASFLLVCRVLVLLSESKSSPRVCHVSFAGTGDLRGLLCAAHEDLSVDFLAQISPITAKALADPVVSVRGLSALTRCTLRTL